jgi:hypothetical protein
MERTRTGVSLDKLQRDTLSFTKRSTGSDTLSPALNAMLWDPAARVKFVSRYLCRQSQVRFILFK